MLRYTKATDWSLTLPTVSIIFNAQNGLKVKMMDGWTKDLCKKLFLLASPLNTEKLSSSINFCERLDCAHFKEFAFEWADVNNEHSESIF